MSWETTDIAFYNKISKPLDSQENEYEIYRQWVLVHKNCIQTRCIHKMYSDQTRPEEKSSFPYRISSIKRRPLISAALQ